MSDSGAKSCASAAWAAATLAALKALKPKQTGDEPYLRPTTLAALLQQRATFPKAQVVAGCTDVGLWVTKLHKRFDRVLDVTAARTRLSLPG